MKSAINIPGAKFAVKPEDSAWDVMQKAPAVDMRSLKLLERGSSHLFDPDKQSVTDIIDQLNAIEEPALFLFHLALNPSDPYILGITRENQSAHLHVTSKCDWKDAAFTFDKYLPSLEAQLKASILKPVYYQIIRHPANEMNASGTLDMDQLASREHRTTILRLLGKETCWYADNRPVMHKVLTAFANSRREKHMPNPFDPFDL